MIYPKGLSELFTALYLTAIPKSQKVDLDMMAQESLERASVNSDRGFYLRRSIEGLV